MKIGTISLRDVEEIAINIDPIQAGGRLTPEAMKAVIAYGDGYSICDQCMHPFRLDHIQKPPVDQFHEDLARFVHMDQVRLFPGARRGFQAAARTHVTPGDPVILTALAHYTEFLAVEESGGVPFEIPTDDTHHITPDAAATTIEDAIRETGRTPALLFADLVDYQYGHVHDVRGIARVAHRYDIPVLGNGAYAVGVMPVDGAALEVDYLTGSGHKSMAAPAPSGLLAATEERAGEVFRTTASQGNVTGRRFGIKEVELMGCTLMGVTLVGMMASFPRVRERVDEWDQELANARIVLDGLLSIEGTRVESELPRRHTLTRVNTIDSFDRVAETHKKRGFFLTHELKRRGVVGVMPGSTRVWKYNTYGLTRSQAEHVAGAFREVAGQEGLTVR
ncbi:MAG: aminotransferase class V-fold PLP-dependent enzyme [Methanomicrobiales archaeon]